MVFWLVIAERREQKGWASTAAKLHVCFMCDCLNEAVSVTAEVRQYHGPYQATIEFKTLVRLTDTM